MKSIGKMALAGVLAIAVAGFTLTSKAEDKPAAEKKEAVKKEAKKEAKKDAPKALPFRGKAGSVDNTAKTLTLQDKRVFQVLSTTKITKDEKPATLEDVKADEIVRGQYIKTADDKLELVSLKIGPKPESRGEEKAQERAKEKAQKAKDSEKVKKDGDTK